MHMRTFSFSRSTILIAGIVIAGFATAVGAWTGPQNTPPTCVSGQAGCDAPLNVGTGSQVKNGALSVNAISVYGDVLIDGAATTYFNFGPTVSVNGYGIRDNNGVMEVKDLNGGWYRFATSSANGAGVITGGTANYVAKYSSATALTESIITDTGTRVGVATTSPSQEFSVTGDIYASGNMYAAGYFHNSDASLKENVRTSPGLSLVEKLRGVTFDWKKDGGASAGVIAQEVEQVLPSAVRTGTDGIKRVEYDQLIAPLIEAIKDQQIEIDDLKNEINLLKANR
jgi:hypothetical protein